MGNQAGQEFDDGGNLLQSSPELARTAGGREVVEKHREFERQLEALRGSSAPRFEPPVPMHGPAPVVDEDATTEEPVKQKSALQLSPEQTEIAAKAAAEAVMRLCPTGTEAEKRRALASIRNTREALAEMPPFDLSFLRMRGQDSGEPDPESGDPQQLAEDAFEEVQTLSTLEQGSFPDFPMRRQRVLCGALTCEQLRRPCEILGYPAPACCSDTTSSFAVGYEEPEDFRRQAMAAALPPVIPEETTTEAGAQHASLISATFQSAQGMEMSRHHGPQELTPSPQSFGARSESSVHSERVRTQTGLVRTLSSASAPGLGIRSQPHTSSFRELRGGLSSARAGPLPSPGMPLAVALSKPLVRQASNHSSFSAPGQLCQASAVSPSSLRHPPPPRTPSGASLPTPARSPINSPRANCQGQHTYLASAQSMSSFGSSPQHSFAQHSFVVMPMSA